MTDPTVERPLRRDAARNRERILEAASELFAERGLNASLNDIAHHAGVGVGTVYRHFPDKDELIEQLFDARVEAMVASVEAGLADPDPWHGFVATLQSSFERQAADRGLHELVLHSPEALERAGRVRERIVPIANELLRRAQAAGAIRPDVEATDLPMLQLMVGAVMDASRDLAPELWRRYLELLLRAIATHPHDLPPLSEPSLGVEAVDRVMIAAPPRRR